MINRIKTIVFFLFIANIIVIAQTSGESGLAFLNIGFGARNISMGNAGNVFSKGVTSQFYNPAKLAYSDEDEIIIMHNNWIQDIRSDVLGVNTRFLGLRIAAGINLTSVNDIEVRTKPGEAQATFDAKFFSGNISTGFKIYKGLSVGATFKYLYEQFFVNEAKGTAWDFGLDYDSPIENLRFSFVVKNIGSMESLKNTETEIPTEVVGGLSYNFELENNFSFVLGGEVQRFTKADVNHINVGGEAIYNKLLAVRIGYQSNYDTKDVTFGFGLYWNNLTFDFAYVPFQLGFGNASLFSLRYKF